MDILEALKQFKEAYNTINELWGNNPLRDLNELNAIELYPFKKSFDEIDVNTWINETITELKEIKKNDSK